MKRLHVAINCNFCIPCSRPQRSLDLLPTGSEEREVLQVGSIPVAIFPSCLYMKILHYDCTDMNRVG